VSAQERETLAALRDDMARAWGGNAAWFTTGAKVANVVADWLREAGWRPPGTDTSDTVREAQWPDGCTCGHDAHLHDTEADPVLCMVCGDNARCNYATA